MEFEVVSLKADYASAIDDCADVHKLKLKLETELQSTYTIKEENSDTDCELEKVKLKFDIIENELIENENKNEKLMELNKHYKTDMKHLNAKHEKVVLEIKDLKDTNKSLEKDLKNTSVALNPPNKM